jgi:hypothetical protein
VTRLSLTFHTCLAAWAVCALSLFFGPAAAQAAPIFDIGGAAVDTLAMTRLPTWVQVATPSARVYVADTGEALATQRLSQYTFLRVLGGGSARLQVTAYDQNGNPGLGGWVDPNDVVPSAPGVDWHVASMATTLWRSTDPGAAGVRSLDRFTPMQQLDGPVQNRIEVQVYAPDFSRALDRGWVDVADTGMALPPQIAVPPPATPTHAVASVSNTQAFIDATARAARLGAAQTGVPASVTVAQAILESDWGRSALAQDANNYFGIKAVGRLGTDGVVWMSTGEFDDAGQAYQTVSAFRAYKSLADSVVDHDNLLRTGSRYAAAMQASTDPKEFAEQLSEAGYATDPDYADKLVALMDRYDLYRLDV